MSQTNGVAEIRIGGKVYPLLFNRAAVQEMSERSQRNLSSNGVKLLSDLVYSGMLNHCIRHELSFPNYSEVVAMIEDDFPDEEDAIEQEKLLWEVFETSRWGSKWVNELNEIKKKVQKITETLNP